MITEDSVLQDNEDESFAGIKKEIQETEDLNPLFIEDVQEDLQ